MLHFYQRVFRQHDEDGNKRTLMVLSKELLEELLDGTLPVTSKSALVSITSPIETPPKIADFPELHIFRMQFQDMTREDEEDAPTAASFEGLKEFVDSMADVSVFIVQCGAGLSRSAGVAQAICEYLDWRDNDDKTISLRDLGFFPNNLVYRLCKKELEGNDNV